MIYFIFLLHILILISYITLQKHAHAIYRIFWNWKNGKIWVEKFWYFYCFYLNIDLRNTLQLPCGGSNKYPQSMFWMENKNTYTPHCVPQFNYIKVGYKGVYFSWTCFPDGHSFWHFFFFFFFFFFFERALSFDTLYDCLSFTAHINISLQRNGYPVIRCI